MKRANRVMLFIGVALAAVSFVAVLALGAFNQPSQPAEQDVSVVVAAADLGLGEQISAEKLSTATRKESEAGEAFTRPEDVIGMVVRRGVVSGQMLTAADFETNVSAPEIARGLRPGLRAIAVPVRNVDSIGSLLQPGDYVDVILSLKDIDGLNPVSVPNPNAGVPGTDGSVPPPYTLIDDVVNNTTVKVVVQNVQVLATMPATPATIVEDGEQMPAEVGAPDLLVMLAVTPQQAEVVRFAQLDGNIALVLRSPGDYAAGEVSTSGITLRELVDSWGVLPPQPVNP